VAIDDQVLVIVGNLALVATVGGVVLEHVDLNAQYTQLRFVNIAVHQRIIQTSLQSSSKQTIEYHVGEINEGIVDSNDLGLSTLLLLVKGSAENETTDASESIERIG